MQTVAYLRYLNIAPRKVRLVTKLIKGKAIKDAEAILRFTIKRGAKPILKLLQSAISNAKQNFQIEASNLYIVKISVDEGPRRKKWRARARGTAGRIEKRTSHISLFLDQIDKKAKKKKESNKTEEVSQEQEESPKTEKTIPVNKPKFQTDKRGTRLQKQQSARKFFRRKAF